MTSLKIPTDISIIKEAHEKWMYILEQGQKLVDEDYDMQEVAAKGMRLKERYLPPEILGATYAKYCNLINKMYDSYLNSVHLQRAPYILEIVSVFMKRLYELRNELVHVIVNDYIYVDAALARLKMTPYDMEIIIPYHFPLEARSDTIENLLQKMWCRKRKRTATKIEVPNPDISAPYDVEDGLTEIPVLEEESSEETLSTEDFNDILRPEYFEQAVIIQKHERFRQYFIEDFRAKSKLRKTYFASGGEEASLETKVKAASLIQKVYREYMKIKRLRRTERERDVMIGLIPDPFRQRLSFDEENNKIYERRRQIRTKIKEHYLKILEQEKMRLITFKKEDQIDDITDEVREWFKEWYYGYGFFPEFPYPIEGGTLMVVRGDFPTIEEKKEADEAYLAATKGKTKEQLKQEKQQAKFEAQLKAEADREQKIKEAQMLFKIRCNPFEDPGYEMQTSVNMSALRDALNRYRASWSIYDSMPLSKHGDYIYGYIKPFMTEELMSELHKDCRSYVDELMRLDLKLLIQMHQLTYKNVGKTYPKIKPRPKPKQQPIPKPMKLDGALFKSFEELFDLGIISKPKVKIKDIIGDYNYAASDLNVKDPKVQFPIPAYGDVKRRLKLSCVFGSGMQSGAKKNKAVMLLGPERYGKSFLIDCVAGEMNAVKIDISPEVFSAVLEKPAKVLNLVFVAAKVFQPTVVYMRNIERVYMKKVPPEDKYLKANVYKNPLTKLIKAISTSDKVIFIATCSRPFLARAQPLVSTFDEIILVPRTDYNSLQLFFYHRLQSIRSMERDYCVQALAHMFQGYGFGIILKLYNQVMTSDRIVKLNVEPMCPAEFLEPLLEQALEPIALDEYQEYVDFFIQNSYLKKEREEYNVINLYREVAYKKFAKKAAKGS